MFLISLDNEGCRGLCSNIFSLEPMAPMLNNILCKHCGKQGHEIRGFFQIIGYREWWSETQVQNNGRGGGGGQGHKEFQPHIYYFFYSILSVYFVFVFFLLYW
ncbi:hypothetical protein DM860_002656 [Cuscuta australis]|uniref:Uncharacterized protein n=1 Tax=Cuscuta australis TaxID=267555 RepID=A0A328D257_9ASTE|nr:hypothetical protein DM860_002656 [Cuscuta australis]